MEKIYFKLYTLLLISATCLLVYISVSDIKNYDQHYFPAKGITHWTDYSVEQTNESAIYYGTIETPDYSNGNILAFYSVHSEVTVYCNDALIYQYPVKNTNPFAITAGYAWNFVPLPDTHNEIQIHVSPSYEGYETSIFPVYLGDTLSIITRIIHMNIIPFLTCFIIFFFGVCMVLFWIYMRVKLPIKNDLFLLGIFAILLSVWSVNECRFTTLMIENNIVSSYISFISLMVLPSIFLQFVKSYYQDKSKIWDIFCIITVIQNVVCLALQLLKIVDLRDTLWTTHLMLIGLIVIVFTTSVKLLKKGINSDQIKTHLFCICICAITSGIDLVGYYIKNTDNSTFGRIGFFLYIVILGFSTVKESVKLMKLGKKANTYRQLAYTDQTTNLYNRTAFNRDFEKLVLEPDDICIINFDLNNLKKVNDTKGHAIGDIYIKTSARIISDTFSDFGKCYRTGGDEFIAVIKKASHFDLQHFFNTLEKHVEDYNISQNELNIQIAYGYAIYDSSTDSNLKDTYDRADKYMYENKRKKKGM